MYASQNSEVLIASGMHQFQHGRIISIDTATVIPFAHIELRGKSGEYLKRAGAYVPLKFCAEIDEETAKTLRTAAKLVRKQRRGADVQVEAQVVVIDQSPLEWDAQEGKAV